MREGFKTKHPSIVLNPVQRTAAPLENTPMVQGPHFCSHLVYNQALLGNTQSVNVVTLTESQGITVHTNGLTNSDDYNKIKKSDNVCLNVTFRRVRVNIVAMEKQ